MANLNVLKKDDLAKLLEKDQISCLDEIKTMTRVQMIEKLKVFADSKAVDNAKIESEKAPQGFVVSNDPVVAEKLSNHKTPQVEIQAPTINNSDPAWTDYVMDLLTEDEKYDGFPTCDGLRRVFELLVGEIINVDMDPVQVPDNQNGGRATVKCTIEYMPIDNKGVKSISDVADCYFGNTQQLYSRHASATAATMAEGRCYRKGLRVRTLVREENMAPKGDEAELATELENGENVVTVNQQNTINRVCDRLKIDVVKLIESEPTKGKTLSTLTQQEAQVVLRSLSGYQRPVLQGGKEIPISIMKAGTVIESVVSTDKEKK